MSELIVTSRCGKSFRGCLLATASAFSAMYLTSAWTSALADGDEKPTVWIELGGQLERTEVGQQAFDPQFNTTIAASGFTSPLNFERMPRYSDGLEGKITFDPRGTDWIFSAGLRYGRSNGSKFVHEQKPALKSRFKFLSKYTTKTANAAYSETRSRSNESHTVLDFQAGRDVGLGLFGRDGSSVISGGLRFAQFSAKSNSLVHARPDVTLVQGTVFGSPFPFAYYHQYMASFSRAIDFRGIGPSLSWDASAVIAKGESSSISIDWGINAAILFGRQKASVHHKSSRSSHYYEGKYPQTYQYPIKSGDDDRSHSVIVPNLGGFAGLSFRYDAAKIKFGYRADFFFGAVDGGIDARKSGALDFHGPFATISIGLGG